MLDIYDEFRKLVEGFEASGIDYALCGGMALAVHGFPRIKLKRLRSSHQDLDDIAKLENA